MINGFEANIETYKSLLSDRETFCSFDAVTLFIRRIVHLIKEREWITDSVILNRFNASIIEPTPKTREIFEIFKSRVESEILDSIAEKLKVSKMDMTHSRFTMDLWEFAKYSVCFDTNHPDDLLTQDGENLSPEEKSTLNKLLTDCKNDSPIYNEDTGYVRLKTRDALLDWMLSIEKNERTAFKSFLFDFLAKIQNGQDAEELKLDLRRIREYLINHYPSFTYGIDNPGINSQVFYPLFNLLIPDFTFPNYTTNLAKFSVKEGRIYLPTEKLENNDDLLPHWVSGFVLKHNNHSTTYIFNGSHYVWLDANKVAQHLTAEELLAYLNSHNRITFDQLNQILFVLPEGVEPDLFPDPSKWTVPGWERQNCFIASALTLLSMAMFYKNQGVIEAIKNVKPAPRTKMKMTHSRFSAELWYYARATLMFGNHNLDILFTKDGEKLCDKDKETLKSLLKDSQVNNTLEYRKKLLAWMLEIEKEKQSDFKPFLELVLSRIREGASQDELRTDLRKIRKYLINRDPVLFNNSGKDKGGNSRCIYQPLLEFLYPGKFKPNYRCMDKTKISIKNGRIFIPRRISAYEFDENPHWAAGFVLGSKEHATAYIFDGTHYVWLDNNRKPIKLTAQELYESLIDNQLNSSFEYFLIPEDIKPKEFPNASNWAVPGWERNNCFIASSLMLIAAATYYKDQELTSS